MRLSSIVFLLLTISCSNGFRILMLPVQLHSHVSNFVNIGKELIKQGHEVYTVSIKGYLEVSQKEGVQSIEMPCHQIDICSPDAITKTQSQIVENIIKNKGNPTKLSPRFIEAMLQIRKSIYEEGEEFFQKIENLKFDLAFVDGFFLMREMYLIPHRLGIPWVSLSDVLDPLIARVPWLPSVAPTFTMAVSDKMTFTERVKNTVFTLMFHFMDFAPPLSSTITEKFTKYGEFSSLKELEARSLLWLRTSDEILDYKQPLMPNIINVGGLNTKPAKPLPADLQKYADSAIEGLVFVSFGSYVDELPNEEGIKLLTALGMLKEKVIWRFGNKNNLTVSPNIKLTGWLPQNDLLAHKNVKLFVTHCGNNGQFEALYHGVPMVGVPLHYEQQHNAARMKYNGYGLSISLYDFTSDEFYSKMRDVMDNPIFKTNINRASNIYKSRSQTSTERAAYWIEHVLKFGGDHLRSHAFNMPLYEYFMLDLIAFVVLLIVVIIIIFVLLLKLFRKMLCKNQTKVKAE